MSEPESQLALAEHVADRTAERTAKLMRRDWQDDLQQLKTDLSRDLRNEWRQDMGRLRDDLTVKGLLSDLQGVLPMSSRLRSAKVLVVEDYADLRQALARVLKAAGMSVVEASTGVEAAKILDEDMTVEVVVADRSIPKNGYTLLEHVREHHPAVELIMTSDTDDEAVKARDFGVFGFLSKPFGLGQAVLLVERAAEFRRLKLAATSRG